MVDLTGCEERASATPPGVTIALGPGAGYAARMARKKGSKGLAAGTGGYKSRKHWGYVRTSTMETDRERELRAKRVAEFLERGGRIQKIALPPVS